MFTWLATYVQVRLAGVFLLIFSSNCCVSDLSWFFTTLRVGLFLICHLSAAAGLFEFVLGFLILDSLIAVVCCWAFLWFHCCSDYTHAHWYFSNVDSFMGFSLPDGLLVVTFHRASLSIVSAAALDCCWFAPLITLVPPSFSAQFSLFNPIRLKIAHIRWQLSAQNRGKRSSSSLKIKYFWSISFDFNQPSNWNRLIFLIWIIYSLTDYAIHSPNRLSDAVERWRIPWRKTFLSFTFPFLFFKTWFFVFTC